MARFRKTLIRLVLLAAFAFLLYQASTYLRTVNGFPVGTTIGEVEVSGLTEEEARILLAESYNAPIIVDHLGERIELPVSDLGFQTDFDGMVAETAGLAAEVGHWRKFLAHVTGQSLAPIELPLKASSDGNAIRESLRALAEVLDVEPTSGRTSTGNGTGASRDGHQIEIESSVQLIQEALRSRRRDVTLSVTMIEPPQYDLRQLMSTLQGKVSNFDGLASIFVVDLQTGDELSINADEAVSGLSILKIGIIVETFAALDHQPNDYQWELLRNTAERSSNYSANLLLHIIAGEDNTYRGADLFTEKMASLGLVNTFIAVPYGASPPAHRITTYVTPANSRADALGQPDESMQTTASEIGSLLAMIYRCSLGGGGLLAAYGNELTPIECQQILELMSANVEGNLIRLGVPEGTVVSHKHGWAAGTHADAGIVYSLGGDYVLVEFLHQPTGWLVSDVSFPLLREVSRATYNYFNPEAPFMGSHDDLTAVTDVADTAVTDEAAGE